MLFSVIIPTYNRLPLLQQTLRSIWMQTFTDYEVLVVDDGSADGTLPYLQSCADRLRLFSQSNGGPGAARNLGLRNANAEYFAFLDSDDLWFPWTLDTYAKIIHQSGKPAFIAGRPKRFATPEELQSIYKEELEAELFPDYYISGNEWRWWGASSFVVRADTLHAAGGFTEKCCEDADLAMRLGEAVGFVQVLAPFTFGYREHAFSLRKSLRYTLEGIWNQLEEEKNGKYPGRRRRANERRRILTRHARPVSLDCLRAGLRFDAWRLYLRTFSWHVRQCRWKYLLGFPIEALARR
jgi:glycosyltransferase involved in cell wall biosynthesis